MSGEGEEAFEQGLARVERLIAALDDLRDAAARETTRQLIQVVLDLHAQGVARLLELVADAAGGAVLIERLAADDQVKGLLLLHGLHPQDIETRVLKAVERLQPHLGVTGVRVEKLDVTDQGVHLRVRRGGSGVRATPEGLKRQIEEAILEAAPDVAGIQIDGLNDAVVFVPVTSLRRQSARQQAVDPGP